MKAAIAQLEISLDTLVTNEPINRAAGNSEQADLEAANAAEIRQALEVLCKVGGERKAHAPDTLDSKTQNDTPSGLYGSACCASDFFRLLGEAFDPLMREYGLGKIEWDESRFVMIFGHCRIGIMVNPNHSHLVGIRSQTGLLTPQAVTQTIQTEVGLGALQSLVAAHRKDREVKCLPIRDLITFNIDGQRTGDSDLDVAE